jgi:hypothetical protein
LIEQNVESTLQEVFGVKTFIQMGYIFHVQVTQVHEVESFLRK